VRQLWAPWRMSYVSGDEPGDRGCFLCRAAAGEAPEAQLVLARDELTFTMLNRFPYASGHVLIVPARHAADIVDLRPDEGSALFNATQRALRALRAAMRPEGFNQGVNLGTVAGASTEHVHLHVVPRWGGDTNFMPVIADVKVLPEHLEATAVKLRQAYSDLETL